MGEITQISGGVCAAQGFQAAGVHCGIRQVKSKRDLSLIYSNVPAAAAAVYTTNLVKGAPLQITKQNIADGYAQAIICNSGNANTCNADGPQIARKTCELLAAEFAADGLKAENVVVASTGVIGQPLPIDPIAAGIPALHAELASGEEASQNAARGIMTTDTVVKEVAVAFELGSKTCHLGGIAKGSGMIHPNMATMLVFITTDAAIAPAMLQQALSMDVTNTFNMISVDGDTSTNDMVVVLANGQAGNAEITGEGEDFATFMKALNTVTVGLCRMIAADGEGATKMLECKVTGASDEQCAKTVAKSVICSSLLKAAMFGADANWGRVLCAIGYSQACSADGQPVDVNKIDVSFESAAGRIDVCKNGAGIDFSEDIAKRVLSESEIVIAVELNSGNASATAWGCDLTYEYVKINGDYRS